MEAPDETIAEAAKRSQLRDYGKLCEDLVVKSGEVIEQWKDVQQNFPTADAPCHFKLGDAQPEVCPLDSLCRSGNDPMDKAIAALVSVCIETDKLVQEGYERHLPALLLFGQCDYADGGAEACWRWPGTAVASADNIFSSLGPAHQPHGDGHRLSGGDWLGDLQAARAWLLRCSDAAANALQHLAALASVKKGAHTDAPWQIPQNLKCPAAAEAIGRLLSMAVYVDEIVSQQACLRLTWDTLRRSIRSICNNAAKFDANAEEMKALDESLDGIEAQLLSGRAFQEELPSRSKLFSMVSLYAFASQVLDTNDKKVLKSLWESYKKLATFHLYGSIMFTPCAFLWHNCSNINRVIDPKQYRAMLTMRQNTVKNLSSMLSKEACLAVLRVSHWRLAMDREMKQWKDADIDNQLVQRATVLLRGLQNARSISRCIRALLYCGASSESDTCTFIVKTRMLDLLKELECIYAVHWPAVRETLAHLMQMYAARLLALVGNAKRNLAGAGTLSEARVDTLSALVLAERALAGPMTVQRLCLLNVALGAVDCSKLLKSEKCNLLDDFQKRLLVFYNFERALVTSTDCAFLMPHVDKFFSAYFDSVLTSIPSECRRLQHVTSAANDCSSFASMAGNPDASALFDDHIATIFTTVGFGRYSLPLLAARTLVDSRGVREHLEADFYKLSTVAPHDWRSYAKMRQLAFDKYGLELSDPHLPGLALGDALDVLEIMRKVHIFTESYNYDLNTQCFVEKSSGRDKRRLYTLSVSQAADSIRCHGFGIMNTTVNYTYKFLRQKFYIFSQFLYDDQIRCHLVRDAAYFRDNCEKLESLYPVARAEKFNQTIRKLGITPDGLTYVDQFRMLITQIGNAMGYVRLIRAGAAAASSDANQYFAQDLDDLPAWSALLQSESADRTSAPGDVPHAAALLQRLQKVFAGEAMGQQHYFQALVEVFASELRNYDKYAHLRYFYVIVPPLILNAVEHVLSCKQRMAKRASGATGEAAFSDDGFAMGVAYILKVLDQDEMFDSLHWFASVQAKSVKEKEMDSISWALRSARIFFRSDTDQPKLTTVAENAERAETPALDDASVKS